MNRFVLGVCAWAALLSCSGAPGEGQSPDAGGVGSCASACTIMVRADGDNDDSSEVSGGQATFPCDQAPIATYNSGGGAVPAGFFFSIGRSGSPDLSIEFTISGQPAIATYHGVANEVAYLVTGTGGPAFVSDPALGGSSLVKFCSVIPGQTSGTSTTYAVHGTVDASLAPWPVTGAGAQQGPVILHAQF